MVALVPTYSPCTYHTHTLYHANLTKQKCVTPYPNDRRDNEEMRIKMGM